MVSHPTPDPALCYLTSVNRCFQHGKLFGMCVSLMFVVLVCRLQIVTESREWLTEWAGGAGSERSAAHARAVSTLARLTAASAEQFHKTAEMLLVKENRDAAVEANALIT
jgi:hypothetical protein